MDVRPLSAINMKSNTFDKSDNSLTFGQNPISFNQIREIRQTFEKDAQALQPRLDSGEHQSLLVAMYEGTEQFLNKSVSDFDVMTYLESLKTTARDLQRQGISGEEFRSSLFRQSQDSLVNLLRQI